MATKLKKKYAKARKRGGIHNHKFVMCAKKCHGNRNCMSACLRRK
jgi:hypothetical protein